MSKKEITLSQVVTWFLTIIAVVISATSGIYQWNQSKRYSQNTHQILFNSAKLAEYDIDLLIKKANEAENNHLEYGQLKFQIDSLNQNLETIKSVNVTSLPKDDTMNYQVYRQDLNSVIYLINSYIDGLREDLNKNLTEWELLNTSKKRIEHFVDGMVTAQNVIKRDKTSLKSKINLYDANYK
ncbi:hypothetical protein [Leuconostoc mesenteroides]|uniref:hypothetical protein n=1 Tax=Leuconostoc mesenteroides TaxID=1245 RepID=UPI0023615700|nr:hypothetical protein [Leuconostoc mesenteroides]